MIKIDIPNEYRSLIAKYANEFNLGGYSNLNKDDLAKSSRLGYQYTGLAAELAFVLFRGRSIEDFEQMLQYKVDVLKPQRLGDNGYDDHITFNGFTRQVDVKGTHILSEDKIPYLNLIIPEREYHNNMIYVAAFPCGKTREDVSHVFLAGWEITEKIVERWYLDDRKFCVPVPKLRDIERLKKFF